MRIMGLDLGTRNIGVAVSDEMCFFAHPRDTIKRISDDKAIDLIEDMARGSEVKTIVIGLPVNMDGTEGERALASRRFAEKIERRGAFTVVLWDERLSTKEAEDILIKASVRRNKRRKVIDKMAAQVILQNYLDSIR
jgi:putative holliday junction resolvase